MANYQLYDAVLYINGVKTTDRGMFTLGELASVNSLNAAKGNGRVWKLYTVENPFA